MPFDLAWGFRLTAPFVTDPSYQVPGLGETYPHTYTAANGSSLNAGMTTAWQGVENAAASNDPRIAGRPYTPLSIHAIFRADLDSGSAPGTGDYTMDVAMGDQVGARHNSNFTVTDDTTVVVDGTNSGNGYNTAQNHYIDASLADVAATTTWTGTPVSVTFSSVIARLHWNPVNTSGIAGNDYTMLPHFRLTKQAAPAAYVLVCTPRPTPT